MTDKRGGHNKDKLSPFSRGSGLVYRVRLAHGLTQRQMALQLHCGLSTVTRSERSGKTPLQSAVRYNLHALANFKSVPIAEPVDTK